MLEPKLDIIIVTIPPRIDMAMDRFNQLSSVGQKIAQISIDKLYDPVDYKIWRHFLECLHKMKDDSTHLMLMHDDMVTCKDFYETALKLIEVIPDEIINFECDFGKGLVKKALKEGKHWCYKNYSYVSMSCIIPKNIVEDIILHSKYFYWDCGLNDSCMSIYTEYKDDMRIWTPCPLLIQHEGYNRSGRKTAHFVNQFENFIGEDKSGLDIDWNLGLDDPPHNKGFSSDRIHRYVKRNTPIYYKFKERIDKFKREDKAYFNRKVR